MTRLILLAALVLSSCGDDRPPAPTAEENARLDATDRMLNEVEPSPMTEGNAG
ncbi:hypothetical protein H9L12_08720 [Sphingomonas rhizophila]|uniref:Argininosuccinate lyase n=1 Tax=Sphingomonas rhizophila TaxID=2071607 RepID=A0A7G9S986_9SPHN|nr:hypothetical protein [Sphingomonas rhizophila]QNN64411.1 hypothetical protein H9L12_08720 [Sphingomonas rhizophila]